MFNNNKKVCIYLLYGLHKVISLDLQALSSNLVCCCSQDLHCVEEYSIVQCTFCDFRFALEDIIRDFDKVDGGDVGGKILDDVFHEVIRTLGRR